MHRSKRCFIPPVAELSSYHDLDAEGDGPPKTASSILIARPRWVWIWYLPRLKHLALTSEFAYRFEFKMLQGCPALEYLRLHMRTTDRHHARVISEKDLYLHGVASPFRIVVPQVAQALHERSLVHRESLGTAARVSWSGQIWIHALKHLEFLTWIVNEIWTLTCVWTVLEQDFAIEI
ncbi:MAG: hypothetical protein JOS17DRAFT_829212 [Linnemannia elongata]|nr:MAG: hypothetical protein JOS17DRAFT_829212 [Linnemannia elongata]